MVHLPGNFLLQCVHTTYFQRHVICGVLCVFAWVPVSNFSIRLTKRCRNSETKLNLPLNCFHSASQKTFKFILSSTFRLSLPWFSSHFWFLLFTICFQLYSYVASSMELTLLHSHSHIAFPGPSLSLPIQLSQNFQLD